MAFWAVGFSWSIQKWRWPWPTCGGGFRRKSVSVKFSVLNLIRVSSVLITSPFLGLSTTRVGVWARTTEAKVVMTTAKTKPAIEPNIFFLIDLLLKSRSFGVLLSNTKALV